MVAKPVDPCVHLWMDNRTDRDGGCLGTTTDGKVEWEGMGGRGRGVRGVVHKVAIVTTMDGKDFDLWRRGGKERVGLYVWRSTKKASQRGRSGKVQ